MQVIMIDGLKFEGPMILDKDEIPNKPAIALIITEAGEGFKIMSILQSEKIADMIKNSPKRECWNKHAYHGNIDVYLSVDELNEAKREEFRINGIRKRKDVIFCDEMPRLEDDW